MSNDLILDHKMLQWLRDHACQIKQTTPSHGRALSGRVRLYLVDLKPPFVLIFAFLRPKDLAMHNGADHHVEDKYIHQKEGKHHCAPND